MAIVKIIIIIIIVIVVAVGEVVGVVKLLRLRISSIGCCQVHGGVGPAQRGGGSQRIGNVEHVVWIGLVVIVVIVIAIVVPVAQRDIVGVDIITVERLDVVLRRYCDVGVRSAIRKTWDSN